PIIGMWAYYRMGRDKGRSNHKDQHQHDNHHKKPFWQSAFVSTTHCSSGCSLGDVAGVPIVAFTGFTIGGVMLYGKFLVKFTLAYIFGIAYLYYGMVMNRCEYYLEVINNVINIDSSEQFYF